MNENIERLLQDRGVLIDPSDRRRPEQIYEDLFGTILTTENEVYDPVSMSVERKLNC